MIKYVTYYRVSTKEQGSSGLGIEAQKSSVERFMTTMPSATVLAEYIEVRSGANSNRCELQRALRRCRLTGASLIVAKLDRLSRDVEFIAQLQKSAVNFVCADMPEANTLTIGLLAVLAQHERELISTRTKDALQAAKVRGVRLGNPNLAKVSNKDTTAARAAHIANSIERNTQISAVIREIVTEASGAELSLQAIADRLNAAGYTTARGKAFSKTTVSRVIS